MKDDRFLGPLGEGHLGLFREPMARRHHHHHFVIGQRDFAKAPIPGVEGHETEVEIAVHHLDGDVARMHAPDVHNDIGAQLVELL